MAALTATVIPAGAKEPHLVQVQLWYTGQRSILASLKRALVEMRGFVAVAAALIPFCLFVKGQATFQVASIKPHVGVIRFSEDPTVRGNRVTAVACTPLNLIEAAYRVRDFQIIGAPAWTLTERYDLEATAAATPLTDDEMETMLRTLLAGRFQLQIRRETRPSNVLALKVAKSGLKFQGSLPGSKGWGVSTGTNGFHLQANAMSMAQLAAQLSVTAPRPVVDQTGLGGSWKFVLNWWPADRNQPTDSAFPDMYAALHQLGLELKSARLPMLVLAIGQISRPTPN